MLERLDAPGYLSRDLVATHPFLKYTIYDEVTLFIHGIAGLSFKTALSFQQFLCRAAGILGTFLLARAAGMTDLLAFVVSMLLNVGATLSGPAVALIDPEPLPYGFAVGLVLLAMGLLATEKPLLASLAGGIALLYDIPIAAVFWSVMGVIATFDRRLRTLVRPALTSLLIFVLLLANLAQLQPGMVESEAFFSKIPESVAELRRYCGTGAWVSLWAGREMWSYLAIWVCGLWAIARIWPILNRQLRWFFVLLPMIGVLSVPVSYLLVEKLRWELISQIQPARALIFTVAVSSFASAIAGVRAAISQKFPEAFLWFILVFAVPLKTRILDLLRVMEVPNVAALISCVVLAALFSMLLMRYGRTQLKVLALTFPLLAMLAAIRVRQLDHVPNVDDQAITEVADWAERNTWGSSMFLFPDAGRELYPGIFRGESRRPLWVDWQSRKLLNYFNSFATEWWNRWQATMQGSFSVQRLEGMLSLPVDYFVLKRSHELANVQPIFANREFVVYDSRDLRRASVPLRLAGIRSS